MMGAAVACMVLRVWVVHRVVSKSISRRSRGKGRRRRYVLNIFVEKGRGDNIEFMGGGC